MEAADTKADWVRDQVCDGVMRLMQEQGTVQGTGVRTAVPVVTEQSSRACELEQYLEGWTIDQAKAWCRSDEPAWSVGFICPSANVASMGVTRAGGRPKFGSEVDPVRQRLYNDFSGGTCLRDIVELDWARIPAAMIWLITLPCIDFARSGGHLGRHGKTGHLYVLVVQPLLTKKPKVFVHEMSDYADEVNDGEEVRMVIALLSEEYVVYKQILANGMADYGDSCHRKRLVLVSFRKDFAGAHEWEVPAAKYGVWKPYCARDIAEPDEDVAEEDKRTRQLHTVYANVPVPAFGQLQ